MNIQTIRSRIREGNYLTKPHAVQHALKEGFEREQMVDMTPKPPPICAQHSKEKVWRQTVFEYTEDGISVRVQNVWAWVCPEDGEPSFTPETVDALIVTVRELVETTKRAKKRSPALTEYAIAVG